MPNLAHKLETISLADYLSHEMDATERSEYANGLVYAMAGASELHNTITGDLYAHINLHLPTSCRVWQSDMKVVGKTADDTTFAYYPDIMAACGENTDHPYYRTNPLLIVEVLSNSTQRIDLLEKYKHYTQIPSLIEYVVVSQDTPFLKIFRRRTNWQAEDFYAEDHFTLESVGLTLQVQQIYRRVRKEVGLDMPAPH
ncbi:Uma2 family endonuclease [Thiolinea disciformis]|uniref:Uma2 family endonuclease n=1 Tax=Thiolinea disciformis TaxID=125614 RepID=UPI0003684CF8|nr:Uma2 family endonuclease [Thiolinea disciformis]